MIPALAAVAMALSLQAEDSRSRHEIGSIVGTFVDALGARDGARIATVVQGAGRPVNGIVPVVDLLEKTRCAVVDGHDFDINDLDGEKASVTLALNGSAETTGAVHLRIALPKVWSLSFIRQRDRWLIARAEPRDWMIGRFITEADNEAARERLLDSADDAREAIRAAAEVISGTGWDRLTRRLELFRFLEGNASQRGDLATVAFIQRRRSRLLFYVHQSSAAIDEAQRAVCTAEESGDAETTAEALFGVGVASWIAGHDAEALAAYAQAAATLPRLADPRPAIRALAMSVLIFRKRDPRKALSYVMKTDELSTAYDWYRGNIDAADARGDLYSDIGDFETAAHWYGIAADGSPRVLELHYIVAANIGLAMCSIERGNILEAKVRLESLADGGAGGDVGAQLGRVLARLGEYGGAERRLQSAPAAAERKEEGKLAALS